MVGGDPVWLIAHLGGCQNYGPFLGTLNIRGCIIIGIQKRTIILTIPHLSRNINSFKRINVWDFFGGIRGDTRSFGHWLTWSSGEG